MSSHPFTAQVRVALKGESVPLQRGTVVGAAKPQVGSLNVPLDSVIVEWDNGAVQKVTIRSLILESQVEAEEAKMMKENEKLEEEFADLTTQIQEKLAQAAKLISESTSLAEEAGTDLQSLYDETRPLMRALDDAGWSTSSMRC